MKRVIKLLAMTIFAAWMITFTGCKKDPEIPDLTTTVISSITATHAVTGGIVTSDGGAEVTVTGFCRGTLENPTTTDNETSE